MDEYFIHRVKPPTGVLALVFAAACTGSARLSNMTGLPLVHISVTLDRARSLYRLNTRRHGSAVRWPRSFQPLTFEDGWDDWAAFRIEPDRGDQRDVPPDVFFADGCIAVPLPAEAVLEEFGAQLAAALRHSRLQEASIRPGYLEARSEADPFCDVVVHPRYTPTSPFEFKNASLVTDLFAIDPATDVWRLAWLAAGAKLAACEGGRAPWL